MTYGWTSFPAGSFVLYIRTCWHNNLALSDIALTRMIARLLLTSFAHVKTIYFSAHICPPKGVTTVCISGRTLYNHTITPLRSLVCTQYIRPKIKSCIHGGLTKLLRRFCAGLKQYRSFDSKSPFKIAAYEYTSRSYDYNRDTF